MISRKNIAEIRQDIRTEIENKLNDAKANDLSDVKTIVYGDAVDVNNLKLPAIWILPLPHKPDLKTGHSVVHDFTFSFISLVKEYKTEKGAERAEDLNARVYDVLIQDRTLNKTVFDVRPVEFNPGESGFDDDVYMARFDMAFRLQRRE